MTLVAIKDWDYNWQETYFLKEPIDIKPGTRLEVEAFYDNSDKNPNNPFSPPRLVFFGDEWNNTSGGDWNTATDWTDGTVPDSSIKNAEIERFQAEVSDWEHREYFEMF